MSCHEYAACRDICPSNIHIKHTDIGSDQHCDAKPNGRTDDRELPDVPGEQFLECARGFASDSPDV